MKSGVSKIPSWWTIFIMCFLFFLSHHSSWPVLPFLQTPSTRFAISKQIGDGSSFLGFTRELSGCSPPGDFRWELLPLRLWTLTTRQWWDRLHGDYSDYLIWLQIEHVLLHLGHLKRWDQRITYTLVFFDFPLKATMNNFYLYQLWHCASRYFRKKGSVKLSQKW